MEAGWLSGENAGEKCGALGRGVAFTLIVTHWLTTVISSLQERKGRHGEFQKLALWWSLELISLRVWLPSSQCVL